MKSSQRPLTRLPFARPTLLLAVASLGFVMAPADGSTRPAAHTAVAPATAPEGPAAAAPSEADAVAGLRPETRLRKLHLVRPDLIPYPIAYEVYC